MVKMDQTIVSRRDFKVIHTVVAPSQTRASVHRTRIGERRKVRVPARLTWRDSAGTLRFASVVTRDISDLDAFVECQAPSSIPLYRLVHFQIERPARECGELPAALRQGKVLSAVYRVGPYKASTGTPQGYGLRLLIEPGHRGAATAQRRDSVAVAN